jgi:serine/threonine protein kinase
MIPDQVAQQEGNREKFQLTPTDTLVGRVLYERFLIEHEVSEPDDKCVSYLAKDLRNFCVKVILRTIPLTELTRWSNTFQEICDTLMRFDHPNIEQILETGRLFDNRPYAVAAYESGVSLNQTLHHNSRLVLDRVAHIVESVGYALGAAHSMKIIHGDVTPANIVITPRQGETESVRLVSFGTAWPADPGLDRFADVHPDSLFYAAPELMLEGGRATPASDIYSLAAVAYRMLTGSAPFQASDREEMVELIARGVCAKPSNLRTDLSRDAEAMILSALQYKSAMRPRDARSFGRDLAEELRKGEQLYSAIQQVNVEVPAQVSTESISQLILPPEADKRRVERKRIVAQNAPSVVPDRAIIWSLVVLLLAGALSIPIFKALFFDEQRTSAVSSIVNKPAESRTPRELRYLVDSQNTELLKASQPQKSEYKITFEADSGGNAYVFSEVVEENGRTAYNVLYPLAKLNGGSAHIEPKQAVKTRSGNLNESSNPEIVWLVWTAGNQDDLESARRTAFETDGFVRSENDVQKIKHFLERNKNFKLDILKDEANQQTVVKGLGDKIVHRIELEHN